MSESYSAQPLATSHADLITCLSFSASVPSLLASTSLDGWIRIHARSAAATVTGEGSNNDGRLMGSNGQRGGHPDADEGGDDTVDDVDGEEQDDWVEVGAVKANDGPVWKAIWGPREYGRSLLVSIAGSVVHVWDTHPSTQDGFKLNLTQRATLVEARGSLRDIAFAPSEFGVKLASIAADSHLRVYECLDPSPSALSVWSLLEDIDLTTLPLSYYSSASHHSHSSSSAAASQHTQLIKGFEEHSPASHRQASLGPSGGSSASLGTHSTLSSTSGRGVGKIESSGAWAVAYCQEAWWGECLAVSSGREGTIRIIHFSPPSYWSQLLVLQPPPGSSNSPVSTIAWAPSCGRSFHLIASGSRDGVARIWKVHPPADSTSQWEATLAAEITDHVDGSSGGIGRVEWNVTGTVLSTAGCDGVVRLWKASYSGEWRNLSAISCEGEEASGSGSKSR